MMLRSRLGLAVAIPADRSTPDRVESMAVPANRVAASCYCSILIAHAILLGLMTVLASPRGGRTWR